MSLSGTPRRCKVFKADHNIFWYRGDGTPRCQQTSAIYDSLAAWKRATGQDIHSLYANPGLQDPSDHSVGRPTHAFTLLPGSPAIRAGWNLGNMGAHDFFGNPLPTPGRFDIGADQAQ